MQLLNWFISSGGQTSFTEHWVYSSHFYLNFCDLHILISTSYWYYSIFNRSTLLKKFKRCVFPSAYKCQWVCPVGSIGPLLPSSGLLVYPLDSWGEAVDCQVGANIHWGEFQRYNCATGISKNKRNVKGQLLKVLHHMWTLKRQIAKKQRGGAWWSLEALGEEGFTMVPQTVRQGVLPTVCRKEGKWGLPKFTISNIKRKTTGKEFKDHQQKETMFIRCKWKLSPKANLTLCPSRKKTENLDRDTAGGVLARIMHEACLLRLSKGFCHLKVKTKRKVLIRNLA